MIARSVLVAAVLVASSTAYGATLFSNGFETDTTDWTGATQRASGFNGVTSADGSFHATVGEGAFTRWGGYNFGNPGGSAFQPYTTSLDIYLNLSSGAGNDTRFAYTSAISNPLGGHLRDFVFSGGFYNSSDVTGPGAGQNRFVFSASNNSPGWPKDPGRSPFAITASGWYTFQHAFADNGGQLLVTMSILDSLNNVLVAWSLGGDPIGNVGGNRYGWFPFMQFASLEIDNASLTVPDAVPVPFALPLFASGLGVMGMLAWRKKKRVAKARAA